MIIKSQKGRGRKIHLLLDDEYRITTDVDFWLENYIPDGTEIDEEEWEELQLKINYRKAFNKCADLLSRRSHSIRELREKLLRTVDEQSAELVIEKYIELGYLNDEDFALNYSEHLFKNKNYSPYQVKQELIKKGINSEIINNILEDNETNTPESIIKIINKLYLNKLRAEGGKDKVIAALMRRGFGYSDIKEAFYRIENE